MFCKCVSLLDVYLTVRFVFHFVIALIHIQSPPEAKIQTLFCSFVSHINPVSLGIFKVHDGFYHHRKIPLLFTMFLIKIS